MLVANRKAQSRVLLPCSACDDRELDAKFGCLSPEFVLEWFVQIICLGAAKTASAYQAVWSCLLGAGICRFTLD